MGLPVHEFVVLDANGKEVDWYDPYDSHEEISSNLFWVDNGYGRYRVEIPSGGRCEIRPLKAARGE